MNSQQLNNWILLDNYYDNWRFYEHWQFFLLNNKTLNCYWQLKKLTIGYFIVIVLTSKSLHFFYFLWIFIFRRTSFYRYSYFFLFYFSSKHLDSVFFILKNTRDKVMILWWNNGYLNLIFDFCFRLLNWAAYFIVLSINTCNRIEKL